MNRYFQIPEIPYDASDWDPGSREIKINLNNILWFHKALDEYQVSHRRLIPSIHIKSPSGRSAGFAYPYMDGVDLVYQNRRLDLKVKFFWGK